MPNMHTEFDNSCPPVLSPNIFLCFFFFFCQIFRQTSEPEVALSFFRSTAASQLRRVGLGLSNVI